MPMVLRTLRDRSCERSRTDDNSGCAPVQTQFPLTRAREPMALDSIHTEITIDADAATVFAFFTEPERLIRWIGVSANLDPKPGGLFLVDVVENRIARGEFKEVVPVSRLVFTWGFEGSPTVAPGSSLIEIDLVP